MRDGHGGITRCVLCVAWMNGPLVECVDLNLQTNCNSYSQLFPSDQAWLRGIHLRQYGSFQADFCFMQKAICFKRIACVMANEHAGLNKTCEPFWELSAVRHNP